MSLEEKFFWIGEKWNMKIRGGKINIKKLPVAVLLFFCLSGTACQNTVQPSDINNNSDSISESAFVSIDAESLEISDDFKLEVPPDAGGQYDFCPLHDINFHAIPADLVYFIGLEEYEAWYEKALTEARETVDYTLFPCGGIGISDVVQEFDISREDFIQYTRPPLSQETIDFYAAAGITMTDEIFYADSYTDEQIDAIYSGDQNQITSAFCGELSIYNEQDGELYTIFRLAQLDAEEYLQLGLPMEEVNQVLETAEADYPEYAAYTEAAQAVMADAVTLEEAILAVEVSLPDTVE